MHTGAQRGSAEIVVEAELVVVGEELLHKLLWSHAPRRIALPISGRTRNAVAYRRGAPGAPVALRQACRRVSAGHTPRCGRPPVAVPQPSPPPRVRPVLCRASGCSPVHLHARACGPARLRRAWGATAQIRPRIHGMIPTLYVDAIQLHDMKSGGGMNSRPLLSRVILDHGLRHSVALVYVTFIVWTHGHLCGPERLPAFCQQSLHRLLNFLTCLLKRRASLPT